MAPPKQPLAAGAPDENDANTLQQGIVRLPLGHSAVDPDAQHVKTYFWFYIPTNTGGMLTLTHTGRGGSLTLLGGDGRTILVPKTSSGVIMVDTRAFKQKFGDFYVVLDGGDNREVESRFVQIGVARESANQSSAPIIPWNFHFWPSARQFPSGATNPMIQTMEDILRKYAKGFGKSESDILRWERDNHEVAVGPGWGGHCHLAAGASILFKQPVARTVNVPGSASAQVAFSEEDLEFLAAEWFGGFGGKLIVFALDKRGTEPWHALLPDRYYTQLLKPSETKLPAPDLARRLEQAIVAFNPSLASKAAEMAKKATARGNLGDLVAVTFAQAAVDFYQALIVHLYKNGNALEADLRGSGASSTPQEVWNHAVFYYEAAYKEILPAERWDPVNNNYMEIELLLVANYDYPQPPSPGLPAVVSQGFVDVNNARAPSRKVRFSFDIAFDKGSGDMAKSDSRNHWRSCRDGTTNDELYAPAYLAELALVGVTPQTAESNTDPDPRVVGNPHVDLDLVSGPAPLLEVRGRYKKK